MPQDKAPPRVVFLAGPTASGKSALALALARELGGAIVNADSMQVYRDLRVLTARPSEAEEREAPHLLYGHVDAARNYSVGLWLKDFEAALARLAAGRQTAVVTGGTGMYFKAALYGLSEIPPVPEKVREVVRARFEGKTPQDMHRALAALDPVSAGRLRETDPQRLLRALEVFEATGRPLASFQEARAAPILTAESCPAFFVAPSREALYARIDARFDAMLEQGALEEVRALAARGLDPALPAMRAHGVPHLIAHLEGRLSLEEAAARGKLDTRHYAKRQFTFARHQLPSFSWLEGPDPQGEALAALRGRET
ncbi:tRNA (adenosine(37)-N6)-dimethylallyltransferase MiaA [Methylocystis bryophila]|uniref:tRNA dimethylallyltransferase n=1 Tax=Methylocystis bryophila TaxID=655015 RepID=A0A1W6MR48_9HYPH|nr:tRNA (adenosine(37)-N6)-dimethylallyltransferase MiaA [Methylocystis bryophila]ARN80047.1 tRNA (adenosine(37)-N6)-dimethylallyltransferase MiaA [Methylocystis bryophila]BDV39963.1 tRNA dimethylallyltransferase [Methylocystis bryophila]